ncbi:hypothetical protein ACLOJK_041483 [Asimina triloba]
MASSCWEIILASTSEGPITAYDADTGTLLACFSNNSRSSPCKGLALAGKTMIATSHISNACYTICLYHWCSSAPFRHLPIPEPIAPLTATIDGSYLFCGGLSGQIHVLSLPSGNVFRSFPIHSRPISCLTINVEGDGSLLISGGDDGVIAILPIIKLLDVNARLEDNSSDSQLTLHKFVAHPLSITAIAVSPCSCISTIVSCSLDCTCKFWSLASGTHLRTVRFPCVIWCVAMDPTMWEFYAGGSDGKVYVGELKVVSRRKWFSRMRDEETGVVAWAEEHNGAITALALVDYGRCLVSASEDGSMKMWDVECGRVIRVVEQERSSTIRDLVVAKGVRSSRGVVGIGSNDGYAMQHGEIEGFSGREVARRRRPVKEVMEMEECLAEVVKDRRRAVDTLEASIATYERLLTLFLNEAKGGHSSKEETKNGSS